MADFHLVFGPEDLLSVLLYLHKTLQWVERDPLSYPGSASTKAFWLGMSEGITSVENNKSVSRFQITLDGRWKDGIGTL